MVVKRIILFAGFIFLPFMIALGQESIKINRKPSPFHFQASYTGDVVSNFSGGKNQGTTYLGLANLKAGFDTEKAGWWKSGEMFVNIGNTHGGKPSEDLVGDFQGISNIEAGNLTFMYELWYKQHIGNVEMVVGLQDLNADFAVSKNGAIFNNSSFGIHSSIADNISTPIFPLTALGLNVKWNISDIIEWKNAIFDGTPDDFENNPYNIHWKLSKEQGFLTVSELQFSNSILKDRTGTFKVGFYYHQHNDTIDLEQRNGGIYMVIDQQLTDKITLFSQIGISPKKMNRNNHYYSVGFNYIGLFSNRPADECGLALAYAGIHDNIVGSETAIEMAYNFIVNKYIYLKPDLQYVINPAGTGQKLNNALVGFIRFGIRY
jgi:porin